MTMNEHGDGQDSVEEQLVGQAFDELAGRATPPDRSAEILARVAGAARRATARTGAEHRAAMAWIGMEPNEREAK